MGWARGGTRVGTLSFGRVPIRGSGISDPSVPITGDIIDDIAGFSGRPTTSGVSLTESSAEENLVALAVCKRIISSKIAELNCFVRTRSGRTELPIWNSPNPSWSKYDFWEWRIRKQLEGNSYHFIEFDRNRKARALHPIDEAKIEPKFVETTTLLGTEVEKIYVVSPENAPQYIIPNYHILHLAGFGYDGLRGYSPIQLQKEAFGVMVAAEKYAATFYASGSMQSGILTTDQRLAPGEADRLKARWQQKVQGLESAHDIVILDAGAKFEPMTVTPVEAQFIDARRYSVENIARVYGIPLSIIVTTTGQYTEAVEPTETTASFLVEYGLSPWCSQIASQLKHSLYSQNQVIEFNLRDTVKTDVRTESSAAVMWRKAQVQSVNELRARLGLDPIDDPRADDPFDDVGTGTGSATEPGVNDGEAIGNENAGADPEDDIADNDDGR